MNGSVDLAFLVGAPTTLVLLIIGPHESTTSSIFSTQIGAPRVLHIRFTKVNMRHGLVLLVFERTLVAVNSSKLDNVAAVI